MAVIDVGQYEAVGAHLADRAYWLVHDDWRGDLRTSPRAADVIVAAALLAELIGAEAIDVRDGVVRVFTSTHRSTISNPRCWRSWRPSRESPPPIRSTVWPRRCDTG